MTKAEALDRIVPILRAHVVRARERREAEALAKAGGRAPHLAALERITRSAR